MDSVSNDRENRSRRPVASSMEQGTVVVNDGSGSARSGLRFTLSYLWLDTKRRPFPVLLSIFVVALIVSVVVVMNLTLRSTGLLFLRFVEKKVGETDVLVAIDPTRLSLNVSSRSPVIIAPFVMSPLASMVLPILDFRNISAGVQGMDPDGRHWSGLFPRWLLPVSIGSSDENSSVTMMGYSDDIERRLGFGRTWTLPKLQGNDSYLSSSIASRMKVGGVPGSEFPVRYSAISFMRLAGLEIPTDEERDLVIGSFNYSSGNVTVIDPASVTTELFNFSTGSADVPWIAVNLTSQVLLVAVSFRTATLRSTMTLNATVDDAEGKWPIALGGILAVEGDSLTKNAREAINETFGDTFDRIEAASSENPALTSLLALGSNGSFNLSSVPDVITGSVNQWDPYRTVTVIGGQLASREEVYVQPRQEGNIAFREATDLMMDSMGVDFPSANALPLKAGLDETEQFRILLDQVFLVVFVLMVILGSILIYSISLSDVDKRVFEFGMLRATGLRFRDLAVILLGRGFRAAIPGLILGSTLSLGLFALARIFLESVAQTTLPISYTRSTIALLAFVGLIVPLLCSLLPTKRALSTTLKDALDVSLTSEATIRIKIEKLERLGIDVLVVCVALYFFGSGVLFYFVLPSAFVSSNFALLFGTLNWALVGMLIGLSLLSQIFQLLLSQLAAKLITFLLPKGRRLFPIISRNLQTHHRRNRLAAFMITMSFSFLIFAGVLTKQQSLGVEEFTATIYGADIVVEAKSNEISLDEAVIRSQLNSAVDQGYISSFTFITRSLQVSALSPPTETVFGRGLYVYGIQASYFRTVFSSSVDVREVASGSTPGDFFSLLVGQGVDDVWDRNLVNVLVEDPNITNINTTTKPTLPFPVVSDEPLLVIMSEAMKSSYGMDTKTPLLLWLVDESFNAQAVALARKLPGFAVSSYSVFADGSPLLMSEDSFQILFKYLENATETISALESGTSIEWTPPPKARLLVDVNEEAQNLTEREAFSIVLGLLGSVVGDGFETWDRLGSAQIDQTISDGLNAFFIVVAVVADALCFLLLALSEAATVAENAWETAVLRATGVAGVDMMKIFTVEGLALVLAATILGTLSGLIVSITLVLQYTLLNETNFSIPFPLPMYCILVGVTVIGGVVVPIISTLAVLRRPIATLLRSAG